ncbi:MAG: ABC transporter permease, partial [Terriglobia bacterium]
MAIPLKYNLRNLIVRRTTTLATALSITLTVAVFVILMALAGGLQSALTATGDPLNVLIMREGSQSEAVSFVTHENYQIIRYLHGIATDKGGNPMADPEEIILVNFKRIGQTQGSNVTIRGVG